MITEQGKDLILRYLAGVAPSFAGDIAVGTGFSTPVSTETSLDFEIGRFEVASGAVEGATKRAVFQSTIENNTEFVLGEIALYPNISLLGINSFKSSVSFLFSASEGYTLGNFNSTIVSKATTGLESLIRVGTQGLKLQAAASSAFTSNNKDYRYVSSQDKINLALIVNNTTPTFDVTLKLYDSVNPTVPMTIQLTQANSVIKYDVVGSNSYVTLKKQVGTQTVDFSKITKFEFVNNGSQTVILDGFKFEEVDSVSPFNAMIVKQKLPSLITKLSGVPVDIELQLGIDFV
jgi:hypothetical protein